MRITSNRKWLTEHSTISELFINGIFAMYVLEDRVRPTGEKVFGETAIPEGVYQIQLRQSPKFNRIMPYLQNVLGFDDIMIHWGNTELDTEGCLIVGLERDTDRVQDSIAAFSILFQELETANNKAEFIWITIQKDISLYPTGLVPEGIS